MVNQVELFNRFRDIQNTPLESRIICNFDLYQDLFNSITVIDNYELDGAVNANRLSFMTWGEVDASRPGVITIGVKGKTYTLTYDKNTFEPATENIPLDDTRLSRVWGDRVVRITLDAKKINDRGTYKILINQ